MLQDNSFITADVTEPFYDLSSSVNQRLKNGLNPLGLRPSVCVTTSLRNYYWLYNKSWGKEKSLQNKL